MIILAIDPGVSGGLALVAADSGRLLDGRRMPTVELRGKKVVDAPSIVSWLGESASPLPDLALVEQVSAMPKQGVSSTFAFGMAYGAALAVAQQSAQRLERVTPAVWKKHHKLGSSKRASIDAARMRFGDRDWWKVQANDGIAEAALMAAWWIDKHAVTT